MIEKKYFLEEIANMSGAILNGKIKTTDHTLIGSLHNPKEINYPVRQLAERLAISDLNKIKEALEILNNYEKAGVKFEFINYKSKEE